MIGNILSALLPSLTVSSVLLHLVVYACIYLAYNWYRGQNSKKETCPSITGVWLLSVLRNLVDSNFTSPHEWADEQNRKYGPIIRFNIAGLQAFNIGEYSVMKKAFVEMGDAITGRVKSFVGICDPESERKSLFVLDGPDWKEHRRFALSTLRDFGIGKASIEPAILNELHYLLSEIEKHNGEAFDLSKLMGISTSNVISILEFGKRFEYNDERFSKVREAIEDNISNEKAPLILLFPFLKYVPGIEAVLEIPKMRKNYAFYMGFFEQEIAEHRQRLKPGVKLDYIDAYLEEQQERIKNNNQPELFDDETLKQNLFLFYLAGSETTSSTLMWALIFMMVHPDIQRKVQKEIDDVIGRERTPSYEDRTRMPYTEAVLMEVHRRAAVVASNVPHKTTENVTVCGVKMPKDSVVSCSIYSAHYDEKLFPDPHTFRPERFINEEGKAVRPEYLIPFSLGKRFCLGEPLARIELFLYFTSMLQKFNFMLPEGETVTTKRGKLFLGGLPEHKLRAILRN